MTMTVKSLWKKFSIFILVICILTSGFTGVVSASQFDGKADITIYHVYDTHSELITYQNLSYGKQILPDWTIRNPEGGEDTHTVVSMILSENYTDEELNDHEIANITVAFQYVAYNSESNNFFLFSEMLISLPTMNVGDTFNVNATEIFLENDSLRAEKEDWSYFLLDDQPLEVSGQLKSDTVINFYCTYYDYDYADAKNAGFEWVYDEELYPLMVESPEKIPIVPLSGSINVGDEYTFKSMNYTLTINYKQPAEGEYSVTYWKPLGGNNNWLIYTAPHSFSEGDTVETFTTTKLAEIHDPSWIGGNVFTGWTSSADPSYSPPIIHEDGFSFIMPAENVDLYSSWSEVPSNSSVFFNAMGGSFDDETIVWPSLNDASWEDWEITEFGDVPNELMFLYDVIPWSSLSAPSPQPVKEGYTFSHWYYEVTDEDWNPVYLTWKFTGEPGANLVPPDSYIELFAEWTPVGEGVTHNVTFNAMGGEFDEDNVSITSSFSEDVLVSNFGTDDSNELFIVSGISNGATITNPNPAPTKTNLMITGWYYLDSDSDLIQWNFTENVVESDITLYAQWATPSSIPLSHYYVKDGTQLLPVNESKTVGLDILTDMSSWPVIEYDNTQYQVDKIVIKEYNSWWNIRHYSTNVDSPDEFKTNNASYMVPGDEDIVLSENPIQIKDVRKQSVFYDYLVGYEEQPTRVIFFNLTPDEIQSLSRNEDDNVSLQVEGVNYLNIYYALITKAIFSQTTPNGALTTTTIYYDPVNDSDDSDLRYPSFEFKSNKKYEVEIHYSTTQD